MNRQDIQKLLGGYATGTLTPEEQEALYAAALEDQELFDALGNEQALRDLLRDPVAKAELLSSLDAPASVRGGYWAWLRRPLVTGLATAGVVAVSAIAVWHGTHPAALPSPAIVAELKPQPVPVPAPPAALPEVVPKSPARRRLEIRVPQEKNEAAAQTSLKKDMAGSLNSPVTTAAAPPPPPPPAAATPPPAPAAPPVAPAGVTDRVEVTATPSPQPVFRAQDASQDRLARDARTLFYENSLMRRETPAVSSFSAGAITTQSAPKATVAGLRPPVADGAPASLGVRVSLLRGKEETPLSTILVPGETVRLRLTPNEDGFLYVASRDGNQWKMIAGTPAKRLQPFETPPFAFESSGQKHLYVMLSRQPQTLSPQALAALSRVNLVETLPEKDRATYVVAAPENGAPQQVVQPITLTYR
jgi:hypothetical protein